MVATRRVLCTLSLATCMSEAILWASIHDAIPNGLLFGDKPGTEISE